MSINNRPIQSINQYLKTVPAPTGERVKTSSDEFSNILNQKLSESRDVKISKHAALRLEARNISLDTLRLEKLRTAVDKAQAKGVKDSLVVMEDVALLVNIPNRTVITAVNQSELKENVFTNIDGAVFT
ncbi:MAG: TIGR02530 family flagellar biosynthesis protein [Bacillota bacterium]|jgi:flagellar operon protein|nr:TIGR02530 family flagellar biosynthesis protein [Bacillota bacterium]